MKYYSWAILWGIVIVLLVSLPMDGTEDVPKFPGMDKLVHAGIFFVFTVLLLYGAIRNSGSSKASFATTVKMSLLSAFFALFTEFIQWKLFTYRSAEAWDLFADAVGIGMGIFAYLLLHKTTLSHEKIVS